VFFSFLLQAPQESLFEHSTFNDHICSLSSSDSESGSSILDDTTPERSIASLRDGLHLVEQKNILLDDKTIHDDGIYIPQVNDMYAYVCMHACVYA
jgi:hypothetical protein